MRFIYFLLFTSLSISSFASSGKDWFDAPLDDCFEAIEKGKFDPSLPLAFKAARLFELKIEDIFDDEQG